MDTKQVILELRTQKGMSQDELAEKVFVSRQAVSRWENGETVPNTETLKLLSEVFDVSINTLLDSPRKLICQCCGMPLEDDDIIGHNHDGSFNEDYCKWCYADGTYTYNDMNDLIEVCVKNMISENFTEEQARSYMKELIEMRIEDPILPMEEGFGQLLKAHGEKLPDDKFSLFMNAMYSVDAYIRDYFRKAAVDELVRAKIPVRLVGEGWEKYESCNETYVTREKAVVFGLSFEKIAHADVLLNVSPFFNHGAHDRIFAGMANHCTVLTDQNPYLKRILKDGEQVCMYSLKDIRTLSDYAAELLSNRALCRDIQNNAYVEFKQKYTWEEKAKQLLACTLR